MKRLSCIGSPVLLPLVSWTALVESGIEVRYALSKKIPARVSRCCTRTTTPARVAGPVGTAATNGFDIPTTGQTRQRLQRSPQDPQLLRPTRSTDFAHRPNAKALLGRQCHLQGHVSRGCASATEPAPT